MQDFKNFIEQHVAKIKPLETAGKLAYWEAATSGNPEKYKKAAEYELQLREIYSNPQEFAYLKSLLEKHSIPDPLLKRQIELLYYRYLQNQIQPDLRKELVELSNKVQENFSTFRPELDGRKITDNEIAHILKTEKNVSKRKYAWEASKQVSKIVAPDIIRLVKLRNQAARALGFDNYYEMALRTDEQEPADLDRLFDELEQKSTEPFRQAKQKIDAVLSERYQTSPDELRPWHYEDPFFQETPGIYQVNLDSFYRNHDIKELAAKFYHGIQLPVEDILQRSDLYEREGKNPHAFCEDIDKEGDVRILCNLKNDETWMETILHELGHAVYDKYIDPNLPYLLREHAHIFTTEGIAMLFGRLSRNPYWMQQMIGLSNEQRQQIEDDLFNYMRLKQLVFVRWVLVMYHFERQLYQNPEQDLNHLWWQLVWKYQMVHAPSNRNMPDWAAKIHFAIAPCYYHNYLLGEIFASQLHYFITEKILAENDWRRVAYVNRPQVGNYLKENIFKVGKRYPWNEMIERATGKPLSTSYYIEQFFTE